MSKEKCDTLLLPTGLSKVWLCTEPAFKWTFKTTVGTYSYVLCEPCHKFQFINDSRFVIEDIRKKPSVAISKNGLCACSLHDIMHSGCKCGGK